MHKLILGSGLTLMALGVAVAAEKVPTTKAGAVMVTESRCQPSGDTDGVKAVSVAGHASADSANAAAANGYIKFSSGDMSAIKRGNSLPATTTAKGTTSGVASADRIHYKFGKADALPSAKTTVPTTPCDSADYLKVQ